ELTESPFAPGFTPPGGEGVEAFHRRVAEAFALIVERRRALSGPLVVVTHGLVCSAILANHCPGAQLPDHFANTSVTLLDPDAPFPARLVNCTQHLAGLDESPGSAPA